MVFNDSITTYGLIGHPLGHSFSKDYFNRKFENENINAQYINFDIEDINQLMELVSEYPDLNGLNVTIPYKEQVMPFLASIDDDAQQVGAVNVIKFIKDDKGELVALRGYNSDSPAFGRTMEPLLNESRKSALVLGTGGASKAVKHALEKLGVEVKLVSRRKSAATIAYEELTKAMVMQSKIIVNTTPLGMYPNVDQCPDFPYRFLTHEHLCYDLIYNPDETMFMKKCKQAGAEVKNGLEMLLLQAFISYEIWTQEGE